MAVTDHLSKLEANAAWERLVAEIDRDIVIHEQRCGPFVMPFDMPDGTEWRCMECFFIVARTIVRKA